ncbi:MAG: ABC transporter permease [Coriobacteriales bacterium]
MQPTQATELFANIRKTFVSFFSIAMFVALGIGVFTGIMWSGTALEAEVDKVHEQGALHDIQIQYPYGLTDENIDALASLDGVSDLEAARQSVRTLVVDGEEYRMRLQMVGERIDVPTIVEGSLPAEDDEIALKSTSARNLGISVGDTIEFERDDGSKIGGGIGQTYSDTFVVTGLLESPEFTARSSQTFGFSAAGQSADTLAWVSPKAFTGAAYLEAYTTINIRSNDLRGLSTFSKRYEEASFALRDRIAEVGVPMADERYENLRSQASFIFGQTEEGLADLQAFLDEKEGEPDSETVSFNGMTFTLGQLRLGSTQGSIALGTAESKVASSENYDWMVSPRTYNGSVAEAMTLSGVTNRLCYSMALLFVVVGLLVSYSAVSRIVHEQVSQIGTKKALGFRSAEITRSFLWYAGFATIAGAIVGLVMGTFDVEGVVAHVFANRFNLGSYPPYFGVPSALIVTAIELVLVLGATWLACRSVLKQHAVELLRGEKPPSGKQRFFERWGIWEKLPLYTQTIVNNCLNDKRRMFSTIVGVAGCTALVVTALTLNDDVMRSYDVHYDNVFSYNAIATASDADSLENVEDALRDNDCATAQVRRQRLSLQLPGNRLGIVRLVVPMDDSFENLYHLHTVSGQGDIPLDDGVWVSEAYARHMGAKPGDKLTVSSGTGEAELVITGFHEYHLLQYDAVIGRNAYAKAFGKAPIANAILVDTGEASVQEVAGELSGTPGFESLENDKRGQSNNFRSFANISRAVVLIYLVLSVLMSIVVLLNLNVMFITEKKRELTILMINGFTTRQAKRYIYNDTIVLTVIGIVIGLVIGCIMGSATVSAVELDTTSFYKGIDWLAVGAGAATSAVLSVIMSTIALRRIPRFDLRDINKL